MASSEADVNERNDDGHITPQQWKWGVLAGMASYLDAGSIVALAAGLALWQEYLDMSSTTVGLLAALGPNAFGAALGALVGGRLGDLFGRKRIYQYDLLVYGLGTLLIVFSFNLPMLLVGTFIVGVAVGADVPTSLALIGEFSPSKGRGKLLGLSQVAWSLGPVVVYLLAFALSSYGVLGNRIVFAGLFVVAIVTWALRRGMVESSIWTAASGAGEAESTTAPEEGSEEADVPADPLATSRLRGLLSGPTMAAMIFTAVVYLFWNLAAGTFGVFQPYILKTLGTQSQAVSVGLSCAGFVLTLLATVFIFMPFSDRSDRARRTMWAIGAVLNVVSVAQLLIFPFNTVTAVMLVVLFGIGAGIAGEAFYKTWSQELFPTMLRTTAQGLTFSVARLLLGIWTFFVPVLASLSIRPVALILMIFLLISGVVGYLFMPSTAGKSLEQIEAERSGSPAREQVTA